MASMCMIPGINTKYFPSWYFGAYVSAGIRHDDVWRQNSCRRLLQLDVLHSTLAHFPPTKPSGCRRELSLYIYRHVLYERRCSCVIIAHG